MSFQTPLSKCSTHIPTLGTLEGLEYANGVQQYSGIPYANLPKRWTRSTLATSWKNNHHDGTKLGNDCPRPQSSSDDDDLVPVPPAPHLPPPETDELSGLVMNIVTPGPGPGTNTKKFPVLVYIHGGSLLYGGASLPIFDAVNLATHSITLNNPIITLTFNYRVGLGGFLSSAAIQQELFADGFSGSGNFGFTDQQVAFAWVQRYIGYLGGDKENVTAVGESAGGISISNLMIAAKPPVFRRAVCMSGLSVAIPAWGMEEHEVLFRAVCGYFGIDVKRPDVLDCLRGIPQQEMADATSAIQGVASGTGNPCLDGWFYARDPREIQEPPEWVEGFILGDTYHEGVIFHLNLVDEDFGSIRNTLLEHIRDETETDSILSAYDISPDLSHDTLLSRVEHMCGDIIFKIPNYATALASSRLEEQGCLFRYHFDQRSRLKNALEGTAYHAHELLYLFGNLDGEFDEEERQMGRDFAGAWIRFCYGLRPWEKGWKIWGPESVQVVKSEEEDEDVRGYGRMRWLLEMGDGESWKKWLRGVDALVNKRGNLFKNK